MVGATYQLSLQQRRRRRHRANKRAPTFVTRRRRTANTRHSATPSIYTVHQKTAGPQTHERRMWAQFRWWRTKLLLASDFLRLSDTRHFIKKICDVKVTFLISEKRKMREILEHCRAAAAGGVMLWSEVVVGVDMVLSNLNWLKK